MMKRMALIAVSLIVVGGVGALATFSTLDQQNIEQSAAVGADEVKTIEVRLNNGSIQLQQTGDAGIRAELTGKGRNSADVKLNVVEEGGTLKIEAVKQKKTIVDLFSGIRDLRLTVFVPEQGIDSLRVKSNNGNILIDRVNGDVEGAAVNGSITMKTDNFDRNVNLDAVNGNIVIEAGGSEPTNATVDMRAVNGKVDFFGSDDVSKTFGNGQYQIKLRSENGDITIR